MEEVKHFTSIQDLTKDELIRVLEKSCVVICALDKRNSRPTLIAEIIHIVKAIP